MNSRFARVVSSLLTPAGLLVMVVILGLSFVAIVLVPGLELASEVAESSTALKLVGEQQRHPTLISNAVRDGALEFRRKRQHGSKRLADGREVVIGNPLSKFQQLLVKDGRKVERFNNIFYLRSTDLRRTIM